MAILVREVWADNFKEEFSMMREASTRFHLLSLDTEFPGTVFSPSVRPSHPDQTYSVMKTNVDALKLIQLGVTLSDSAGDSYYVWQFNFKDFDVGNDLANPDSIAILKRQGVDFEKNKEKGIDSFDFACLFLQSELLFNQSSVSWVTFHGTYDFAFLIKLLTQRKLPDDLGSFLGLMTHYFGVRVYDLKCMAMTITDFRGGLEKLGQSLGVGRVAGNCHEAGSDSLFTLQTYVTFRDAYLTGMEDRYGFNGFEGLLFGLCRKGLVHNYAAPQTQPQPQPQPQLLFVRRPQVNMFASPNAYGGMPYLVPLMMAPVM